ncbi:TPA: hypothetical protein GX533_01730 [Candidatus Dojkabacteria bacterium]|jgi:hypothetical protein|uniref:Uncharacterized protein n=1 Tax=Candidatus Dojkabacteria bacterium TaxID=2099670 RepID=A0A832QDJ8_9BACT|nr:hypothetical protein [Candidatus Dojkabacteria bacterium]
MAEQINLLKAFEVIEDQKVGLYRLIKVNYRNQYIEQLVVGALFWAYLAQEEEHLTSEKFLEIGERELKNFSASDRLEVLIILKTFWERTVFFDEFLKKYQDRFVGEEVKIKIRRPPRTRIKHY